jgi:hypothetical protein
MTSKNTDHTGIWRINHDHQTDPSNTGWCEAAQISAEIIRWLPLLAANDFLEQDGDLPPVA